mgnify:CR=1 FL=1
MARAAASASGAAAVVLFVALRYLVLFIEQVSFEKSVLFVAFGKVWFLVALIAAALAAIVPLEM